MKNFEEIMSERKNRIEARKDELIRRSLLSEEFLEMIQKNKRPFDLLMSYYQCAVMEIETKFRVLNQEYSLEYDKNPIEGIKTRIKSYDSIVRKIRRKNIPMSLTAIEENIKDIAGVRQEIRCDLFHGDASLCYSLVSYGGEKQSVQENKKQCVKSSFSPENNHAKA